MAKPKTTKVASSYKYASKLTGHVMDQLIAAQLGKSKKQTKMTEKFLGKMKLAIQKKISLLSRDAFAATPVTAKTLQSDVDALRAELMDYSKKIKETAALMLDKSKVGTHSLESTQSNLSHLLLRPNFLGSNWITHIITFNHNNNNNNNTLPGLPRC
jgi:hypothetical protein